MITNEEIKKFILEELFKKYKTKNYKEIGRGISLFFRKLKYKNKLLFNYILEDLNISNPFEFLYLVLNNVQPNKCKVCGKNAIFININSGYRLYCSGKCSKNDNDVKEKIKQTCLKRYGVTNASLSKDINKKKKETFLNKYGVDHPFKLKIVQEKFKQTCLNNYGVENPLQSNLIKEKIKQTCLNKYGVENISQVEKIKEKKKNTLLNNYGVEHSFQSDIIKNKCKETCLEKYGVDNISKTSYFKEKSRKTWLDKYGTEHPFQNEEIKEKYKQTCLGKYGSKYPLQNKEVQEKLKETCLEKYGVDNISKTSYFKEKSKKTFLNKYGVENPLQNNLIKEKIKQTCLNKYGFEYPLQNKQIQEKLKEKQRKLFYNKLINSDRLKNLVKPNFTLEEYSNTKKIYSFTCLKCSNVFESNLDNGIIPKCPICFPKKTNFSISKYENEIYNFLKENLNENEIIEQSNRDILDGLELDIYIPNKNLAIEFNGLYWHSERNGKSSNYHLNKTKNCAQKHIYLIHIFEDEWIEKQDIIKSILLNKLGKTPNRIYARKCNIKEIDNKSIFNFLDSNHLQGFINGIHFGLFYNDELVSCLTMGKPRFNKNFEYEILRFCNKNGHLVIGGFSKLFNYFINKYIPNSVITYCDLRYGVGFVYLKNNFEHIGTSSPNYYYLNENLIRLSRLNFQKHLLESKLTIFDSSLTEWENMQLNNYDRIWDCGNAVYSWKKGF